MNEAKTRREIIDRSLLLADWNVNDPSHVTQELAIDVEAARGERTGLVAGTYGQEQFADYGLKLNGRPIAVVEAKRTSKDPRIGREQAYQYAQNIQRTYGGRLPFVFYTNGFETYFWDSETYPPLKVLGFPSRPDLEWMDLRREQQGPLSTEMINTGIAGREYQIAAIRSVLEGIEAKRRRFLLVMATGTGKTRVAVALSDLLMRAHRVKRVLFLVDRTALRDQALDTFKEHVPSQPVWPRPGDQEFPRDRRVYVCTYPTMLNLIQAGTTRETWMSPFFFDLVIADESHRSIYNIYRQAVGYFHAFKLGLTATPQDRIDRDTFNMFDCASHDPTYAYSYDEALHHDPPYLCEMEVLNIRTRFQIEGIHAEDLSEEERQELAAEGKHPDQIDFEGTDLERKVTNAGTNALIVRDFMEESIKDPSGTLPGKSIVFALSKAHARRLEEIFDRLYPEHAGKLARVLVSEDPRVHGKGGLLGQFKTQDMPRVAISVDMLDTGVDVPEVVNLVFAKPVYSYIKFWQMIGRGTRVLNADPKKRRSWCPEKDRFLILDCWGNFQYFRMNPRGKEPGQAVPLPVRLFLARLDKLVAAMAVSNSQAVQQAKADLRRDIASLPARNTVVLENRRDLAAVEPDTFWINLPPDRIEFLRATISPIFRARPDVDVKAMRFEIDVVNLGTALLSGNVEALQAGQASIQEQVSELPLTVNLVARERDLIESVLGDSWWTDLTHAKVDILATKLAPLMRFRVPALDPLMKLDLRDVLHVKEWMEFGPSHERLSTSAYRERIEALIRSLLNSNPVLQKLAAGGTLSEDEIHDLADILESHELNVTVDALRRIYDNKRAHFLDFIQHILGLKSLERWSETVTQAFDRFVAEHDTLTSHQILFLQTLRSFILQRGKVDPEELVSPPFTNLHPDGIRGLFQKEQVSEIISLTHEIG